MGLWLTGLRLLNPLDPEQLQVRVPVFSADLRVSGFLGGGWGGWEGGGGGEGEGRGWVVRVGGWGSRVQEVHESP